MGSDEKGNKEENEKEIIYRWQSFEEWWNYFCKTETHLTKLAFDCDSDPEDLKGAFEAAREQVDETKER